MAASNEGSSKPLRRRANAPVRKKVSGRRRRRASQGPRDVPGPLVPARVVSRSQQAPLLICLLALLAGRRVRRGFATLVLGIVTLMAASLGLGAPTEPAVEGAAYRLIVGPVRRARIITTIREVAHEGTASLDAWLSALSDLDLVAALGRACR